MSMVYDKNRRPFMPGDVLKVAHFIGARGKRHYMYKQVIGLSERGRLEICHLEPSSTPRTYDIAADGSVLADYEIVQGFAGGRFDERERKPDTAKTKPEA